MTAFSGGRKDEIAPDGWYNQADAARLLKIDRRTLRRWEIVGKLVRNRNEFTGLKGYHGAVLRRLL